MHGQMNGSGHDSGVVQFEREPKTLHATKAISSTKRAKRFCNWSKTPPVLLKKTADAR